MTTNFSSIGDWSTSANSNTTLDALSIAENCNMNVINNGLRSIMAGVVGFSKTVDATGGDTYTATLTPIPDNLNTGMTYNVNFTAANTSTNSTLKFNSFGSATIVRFDGSALNVGDLNGPTQLRFDGTHFQVSSPHSGGVNSIADGTNGGLTFTGSTGSVTAALNPNDLTTKANRAAADFVVINDVTGGNVPKKLLLSNVLSGAPIQTVITQTGSVNTGSTTIPFDNTIPQNTEGNQYMSASITPTSTSSILVIDSTWVGSSSVGSVALTAALFQDSTVNALAAATMFQNSTGGMVTLKFTHHMTANTTSATTFSVRGGTNGTGSTTTFNGQSGAGIFGGVMASSLIVQEYLP